MFKIHTNKCDEHECFQSTLTNVMNTNAFNSQYTINSLDLGSNHQFNPMRHESNHHQYISLMHKFNHHQYIFLIHGSNHYQYIPLMHRFNYYQYIPLMYEFNMQPSKNFKTFFIINIVSRHYYSYFKSKSFATSCLIHFQKTITCKQSLKYSTRVLNNL